jgi:L-ascorbate metabolism protein UlaG (beta-lactamase superfamily)
VVRLLDITWHGHSCFRLRGRDVAIVTDPYDRGTGFPTLRLTADVVSISHEHPNHSHVQAVQAGSGRPRFVDGPGEYEIGGAMIAGVATYRDKQRGKVHGKNTAYLFEFDDLSVCHLGDLGHSLSAEQIEALKDADVLLVPVGGQCTIDASEAAEVVSQLEPKIVIPMHYGTPKVQLDSAERFCKELAAEDPQVSPKLTVTRSSLPAETQVVLLAAPDPRR